MKFSFKTNNKIFSITDWPLKTTKLNVKMINKGTR